MANLSYCRFENTLRDLLDCQAALDEGETEDLSNEERRAMKSLLRLCAQIVSDHGDGE